jgi:dolichyl-phosphate beta-glucosyltransferase
VAPLRRFGFLAALSDIAIGSRALASNETKVATSLHRRFLGRVFNKCVNLILLPSIADTQCGFKMFTRNAGRDIFSRCKVDGYGFDFESLMIAKDLGYRIEEIPIRWSHQEGSKVSLLRDGSRMLVELIRLRLAGKRRRIEIRP